MTTLVANTFYTANHITNFFKNLVAEIKRRKNIRETINVLSSLSDYELNDIGLGRCDIHYIAHSSFPKALGGEAVEANRNLRGWV